MINKKKKKIVVASTGASGAIYTKLLLDKLYQLEDQVEEVAVMFSGEALNIWEHEIGDTSWSQIPFRKYDIADFYAPFASGSSDYEAMIICPASMGTVGRIAHTTSEDLIVRTADVMLKERRTLILVPRETPYNIIHIQNMESITRAGGIICPASPSFYSNPQTIEELVATVTDRVLQLCGLAVNGFKWGE